MNSILVKAVMLLSLFYSLICSDLISGVYCNPGLKLGVQFGRKPEFILGFENSITAALYYGWPYAGIVGGIEFNFGQRKIVEYWEVEFGFTPVGVAFGGEWNRGYHSSIRIFGGGVSISFL